ncbi:MAG TPA: SgcJ/EcaC family oxidoreductase, partial [Trebonia sp.]
MTVTAAQPTRADMAAIASLTQRMIAAWAVGDAAAIAGLFVDDGTMILAGTYCDSRAAIEAYFADAFQSQYQGTQVTGRPLATRFFGPDAGVLLTVGGVL